MLLLHKVVLSCGLVEGDVHIAVRPALPLEGVDVILGNDLAGDQVWATGSPVKISALKEPDDCEQHFPKVFTACGVTRAMTKTKSIKPEVNSCDFKLVLPNLFSISQQELVSEQKEDGSLSDHFEQVKPVLKIQSSASGYFLQDV